MSIMINQVDLASSGNGGIGNYIIILLLVGVFGLADALVQGGVAGDLSYMDPTFVQVKDSPE